MKGGLYDIGTEKMFLLSARKFVGFFCSFLLKFHVWSSFPMVQVFSSNIREISVDYY